MPLCDDYDSASVHAEVNMHACVRLLQLRLASRHASHTDIITSHQCFASNNIRRVHKFPPGSNTQTVLKAERCSQ